MVVGYQAACFMHRAAALRIVANRDAPDTVYVIDSALAARLLAQGPAAVPLSGAASPTINKAAQGRGAAGRTGAASGNQNRSWEGRGERKPDREGTVVLRRGADHDPEARRMYEKAAPRRVESFRFNPNTVSVEDLQRLGFSERQAQSIENYRRKGGQFRRKDDFAKSYVVADSVFRRLEPFIDIPKTDINRADSAAFDALPGIGPYLASRMVSYREALGGYDCPEQLLNIYHFDGERFEGLRDLIVCSPVEKPTFWALDVEGLRAHPDIRSWSLARAIVLFRNNNPPERHTAGALLEAGVISEEQALRLGRCERRAR